MLMKISDYKGVSQQEIQKLYASTFSDSEGPAEGEVIGALVLDVMNETAEEDIFGFVATEHERLLGCIFFTRLLFDAPLEAFLLSPVAVHSDHQGQQIGQQLIRFGLDRLRAEEVELVFTYGDPNFYSKVGFEQISEALIKAPFELSQPEGWLGQSLAGGELNALPGDSRCVKAFNDPELW